MRPCCWGQLHLWPQTQTFASEQLIVLSAGNARVIRLADRLDGRAADFGRAFWKVVAEEAPLTCAAIKTHGLRSLEYTDRYLMTPLTLRLLFEVLNGVPGGVPNQMSIETARLEKTERPGWAVFHSFAEDGQRRTVLQSLMPTASVQIRDKKDLPHARCLALHLNDRRRVLVLLDQGFRRMASRNSGTARFSCRRTCTSACSAHGGSQSDPRRSKG